MRRALPRKAIDLLICAVGVLLSGCQSYRPHPLPTAPDLAAVPDLNGPAGRFDLPGLVSHVIPGDGLDEISVITLAVFNNPDLKAARLQAGVASAQVFDAGLLPDPVLGAGAGTSALNYGYGFALTEDIQALLVRGAAKAAARQHEKQIDLNILWQESQVAEQARELFLQAHTEADIDQLLTRSRDLFAQRYSQDQVALQQGNVTLLTTSADLSVLADSETNLRQEQLETSTTRQKLNQLLGLEPNVRLNLIGPVAITSITADELKEDIVALPHRRADLLALQAGYSSQEENVRRSILAQFPPLNAGFGKARDAVEGVNSSSLNVNLTLPIFNRNRGQIAIQRATRELLRQTYQAQLDGAASQAGQVWAATQILSRQIDDLEAQLPILEKSSNAAEQSFEHGTLNAGLYVTLRSNFLAKQVEALRLRESIENDKSALRALLGLPFTAP